MKIHFHVCGTQNKDTLRYYICKQIVENSYFFSTSPSSFNNLSQYTTTIRKQVISIRIFLTRQKSIAMMCK